MSVLVTGPPAYIPYPDPDPVDPDYLYPETIRDMAIRTNDALYCKRYIFSPAATGTISTTEVEVLNAYTFTFRRNHLIEYPGTSLYANINLTTTARSAEVAPTDFLGYLRCSIFYGGLEETTSGLSWFSGTVQQGINVDMRVQVLLDSLDDFEVKLYAASSSNTKRMVIFNGVYPSTLTTVQATLTCSFFNGYPAS